MTEDEFRAECRAAERGLARRADFMQRVRYLNASVDESERRREGLTPKPIAVPEPPNTVDFIVFNDDQHAAAPSPNPGQSRAGYESSGKRSAKTLERIAGAQERLRSRGAELTPKNIAAESNLHKSTVARRTRYNLSLSP